MKTQSQNQFINTYIHTDTYIYEALHVSHDQRCAINLTDLADIFTVSRANIFRKKPKISAQTDQPVWRYIGHNY
jgi:hypothetical protein